MSSDALVDSVKELALKIIEESPNIPTEASIAIKNIKNTTLRLTLFHQHEYIYLKSKIT